MVLTCLGNIFVLLISLKSYTTKHVTCTYKLVYENLPSIYYWVLQSICTVVYRDVESDIYCVT